MDRMSVRPAEWIPPAAFAAVTAFVVWNLPRYILHFGGGTPALRERFKAAAEPGVFLIDMAALALLAVLLVLGVAFARPNSHEPEDRAGLDRLSLFLGRTCMIVIAVLVGVMTWEVFVRYVLAAPTLWANELSLWLAGFVFLLSGLYAMQQRTHIRIYLVYDLCPRWLQRLFDVISTALIVAFAVAIVWGGFREARDKFLRWETFGTAFDPPIPATIKPFLLIVICLVALQAVSNLFCDWGKAKKIHTAMDDIEDIEELKAAAGVKD